MKCMWVARYCRDDLLRAVNGCASRVSKWTDHDDTKLTRLTAYMKSTRDWQKIGFIGDALEKTRLVFHTDANFADDHSDMTSTSGAFLCLWGQKQLLPFRIHSQETNLPELVHHRG